MPYDCGLTNYFYKLDLLRGHFCFLLWTFTDPEMPDYTSVSFMNQEVKPTGILLEIK